MRWQVRLLNEFTSGGLLSYCSVSSSEPQTSASSLAASRGKGVWICIRPHDLSCLRRTGYCSLWTWRPKIRVSSALSLSRCDGWKLCHHLLSCWNNNWQDQCQGCNFNFTLRSALPSSWVKKSRQILKEHITSAYLLPKSQRRVFQFALQLLNLGEACLPCTMISFLGKMSYRSLQKMSSLNFQPQISFSSLILWNDLQLHVLF